MLTEILERRAAITGVGLAMAGRSADRSALNLTLDAIFEALADAGLRDSDIDGLSSWPGVSATPGMAPVTLREVKESLALKLNWFAASPEAPGQLSAVMNAAMAVASGQARHVLCFRTLNQYSAQLQRRALTGHHVRLLPVRGAVGAGDQREDVADLLGVVLRFRVRQLQQGLLQREPRRDQQPVRRPSVDNGGSGATAGQSGLFRLTRAAAGAAEAEVEASRVDSVEQAELLDGG